MTEAAAADLWTKLVTAMRQDGLIAHCVTKSGPATTAAIVQAVSTAPWLKADIKPEPGRNVLAKLDDGRQVCVYWSDLAECWLDVLFDSEVSVSEWRFLR